MAQKALRLGFRAAILIAVCVLGYYIGRPVYWKLAATLQDIKEKEYTHEAVKQGFSDLVQNSFGWGPGETEESRTGVVSLKDSEERLATQLKDAKLAKRERSFKAKDESDSSTATMLSRRLLASTQFFDK